MLNIVNRYFYSDQQAQFSIIASPIVNVIKALGKSFTEWKWNTLGFISI